MLTEMYRQLIALLEAAGFTAYAEDAVPPDASFPFVTLRIEAPAPMQGSGAIVLTGWTRGGSRHRDRLAMADALLRIVPGAGLTLPLTDGLAVLRRADRLSVTWPENQGALGAQVRHALRIYGRCDDA